MENNQQKIPISDEHDQRKRKRLVDKINRFIQLHQDLRLSPDEFIKIMDLYQLWNACHRLRSCKVFSRKVLYFIIERMFWSQFEDSQYLKILLNFLYETDGNFYSIIVPETSHCLSLAHTEAHAIHEFFLLHAYHHKLCIRGYRLSYLRVDTHNGWHDPIRVAISERDPILLHLMMRYGILLSYEERFFYWADGLFRIELNRVCMLSQVLYDIKYLNPQLFYIGDLVLEPNAMTQHINLLKCYNLLFRDFNFWVYGLLYHMEFAYGQEWSNFLEKIHINVLPNLKKFFLCLPLDLKQVCRQKIRKILNYKWLLPH